MWAACDEAFVLSDSTSKLITSRATILTHMDVFISWSGKRSEAVATALHNWLPKIINALSPWLSTSDIDKGARWSIDVAQKLESSKAGIICLTTENIHNDWILFEAGALSKTLQSTFVCPLLIGLEPSDIKGPLAQFQATRANQADIFRLLNTLNSGLGAASLPDAHIKEAFEVWWPKLDAELNRLPGDESSERPQRSERDLLEEILDYVRNQSRLPWGKVTEDDKAEVIKGRINRVLFATKHVKSITTADSGPNIEVTVTRLSGASYAVVVPKDTPLEAVEALTRAQVPPGSLNPDSQEAGLYFQE